MRTVRLKCVKGFMNFYNVIVNLIESCQKAWNNSDLEKFETYFEDDIVITMEGVKIGGVYFEEQHLRGKKQAMDFIRKYRNLLPLRFEAEYKDITLSKHFIYQKFFYELKMRAQFDCVISEYGRYKEFHISKYENVNSDKVTIFHIVKNIIQFRLKNLFGKNKK